MAREKLAREASRGIQPVWAGVCLVLLVLATLAVPDGLSACAMSALISREGFTLDGFPEEGPRQQYWRYDDPWDYLGFVMANSTRYNNNDGYGVVAYSAGNPYLDARWYKRVKLSGDFGRTYYTGPYLDWDDGTHSDGWDVLDTALEELKNGQLQPAIVLSHARNATGHTFGNHPFTFESVGRTFSFMHNGWCNNALSFMIERIRALDPEWFKRHPSEYFGLSDPLQWVDSEVLFHYLLSHITAAGGEVMSGLKKGLAGLKQQLEHPQSGIYNFVMSDGERLYVFRNTPLTGSGSSYKLSYKAFKGFYAVRTLYPGGGDVELRPRELVMLSQNRKPARYPDFHLYPEAQNGTEHGGVITRDNGGVVRLAIAPNPFADRTRIRVTGQAGDGLAVSIFDIRGRKVWGTEQRIGISGVFEFSWDGRDRIGKRSAAGVYLIKVQIGEKVLTGRVVLIR